tara:strand:- start:120 stop:392 length:273 start_codon:yes stop_codon:yes gene_type:complete
MDRVGEISKGKYSDGEFLYEIRSLDIEDLRELLAEIKHIHDGAQDKLNGAMKKFRETGIAADPEWFSKCKMVTNIRKKHILMIERQISLR